MILAVMMILTCVFYQPALTQATEVDQSNQHWPKKAASPDDNNIPLGDYVNIKTDKGDIKIELYPTMAPRTVANFKALIASGFYNGLTFHRVVPDYVVQGGDPAGDGTGGPGYTIKHEFNILHHLTGSLGMARGSRLDSAASQFYICLSPQSRLDGNYTVFGKVIKGMSVVNRIEVGDVMKIVTIQASK